MAGTKAGAKKAVVSIKEKYGEDFYQKIGRKGGRRSPGPFAYDHELAVRAGTIGGKKSRRGPAKNKRVKIAVECLNAEQEDAIEVTTFQNLLRKNRLRPQTYKMLAVCIEHRDITDTKG